jgi:hypothetical protein
MHHAGHLSVQIPEILAWIAAKIFSPSEVPLKRRGIGTDLLLESSRWSGSWGMVS